MSSLGFSRFVFSGEVTEGIDPSRLWSTRNVAAPGMPSEIMHEVDTRFDGEPSYEGDAEVLWGYCIVEGGAAVLSCSTALDELEVPSFLGGCQVRIVAPRAFANMAGLRRLTLPDAVEEICDFAFMFSGLESFTAPPALRSIGARAFFSCQRLYSVILNDGLEAIGREAFGMTRIARLDLPASVSRLGVDSLAGMRLTYVGEGCSLRIAPQSRFFLDEQGGLYRREEGGALMVRLMADGVESYRVQDGCTMLGSYAFAGHEALQRVELPEGLQAIGNAAFLNCPRLAEAELPSTLEVIGNMAFKNCALRSLRLPASLYAVGYDAFVSTLRDIYVEPYIQRIEVDPANKSFYVEGDMLCLRGSEGEGDVVMLYFGRGGTAVIPAKASAVGPSAFAGQTRVNRLVLHGGITHVDAHAFFFESGLGEVVFVGAAPDGSDVTVRFPISAGGTTAARSGFRKGGVDARIIMHQADNALFGAANLHERYILMGRRLLDPVWLAEDTHEQMLSTLSHRLPDVCLAFARSGFLEGYAILQQEGVLNDSTFDAALAAVAEGGEPAAVNELLEIRRTLNSNAFDFDL